MWDMTYWDGEWMKMEGSLIEAVMEKSFAYTKLKHEIIFSLIFLQN